MKKRSLFSRTNDIEIFCMAKLSHPKPGSLRVFQEGAVRPGHSIGAFCIEGESIEAFDGDAIGTVQFSSIAQARLIAALTDALRC